MEQMGLLSFLGFGKRRKLVLELLERGALIVDVRSQAEFNHGHIEGSICVPLGSINHKIQKLKKLNKPLVLCCSIGMKSGTAVHLLRKEGIECINGGGWRSLV